VKIPGKPQRTKLLGKPRLRYEDNIKTDTQFGINWMEGFCELGNEYSNSISGENFFTTGILTSQELVCIMVYKVIIWLLRIL
jgi:hypothetical protein